jgi:hypothetical protein
MGIAKNVSWCDPMGARPETAKLKWILIRGKTGAALDVRGSMQSVLLVEDSKLLRMG